MKRFFPYLGAKHSLIARGFYPEPKHEIIIEPFAGSAAYATAHGADKVCHLVEVDPLLRELWDWLIKANPDDILRIPIDLNKCNRMKTGPAKWLAGFWCNQISVAPRKIMHQGEWADARPVAGTWSREVRTRIAEQVQHIKRWQIFNYGENYFQRCEPHAWFIDPPYSGKAGTHYKHPVRSFTKLAKDIRELAKDKDQQIIVCEGEGEGHIRWLPFRPLGEHGKQNGGRRQYRELIYTKN